MYSEYRFYYDGLTKEEREELRTLVKRYCDIPEDHKGYILGIIDTSLPIEKVLSSLPDNIRYEKVVS